MSFTHNRIDNTHYTDLPDMEDKIKSRIRYYEKELNKLNDALSYTQHKIEEHQKDLEKARLKRFEPFVNEFLEYLANPPEDDKFDKEEITFPLKIRKICSLFNEWKSKMYSKDHYIYDYPGRYIIDCLQNKNLMENSMLVKLPTMKETIPLNINK